MSQKSQPILQVSNVTKRFGNLVAVNDVSLQIYAGEILGLIGPNGAGKTTLFNAITGLARPDSGRVIFKGVDITDLLPHRICRLGMSRTFQVTKAFNNMRVEDAIRVGAYNRHGEKEVVQKVDEVIQFCDLEDIRLWKCGDLGLAQLRRVELARAMATEPDLLLLDEAGAGLNATELSELMAMLRRLNRELGITLCVVEHVMPMVMSLCGRIIVLESGRLIAEGTPDVISRNERVIEAYLGERGGR
ncbi:MAG TPA: ABC transporter ATP-binding protein [Chloroflexi bacterium]|nr:ABC transporter ATP-binding protein [Chloroflexota bacterium]